MQLLFPNLVVCKLNIQVQDAYRVFESVNPLYIRKLLFIYDEMSLNWSFRGSKFSLSFLKPYLTPFSFFYGDTFTSPWHPEVFASSYFENGETCKVRLSICFELFLGLVLVFVELIPFRRLSQKNFF